MFPGRTNNEMLRLMMAIKGRFPTKQLKLHFKAYETLQLQPHFESDQRFRQHETDSISKKEVIKLVDINSPSRDLSVILRQSKVSLCFYLSINLGIME
jgi:serine/threonine-protein kinase PRP4